MPVLSVGKCRSGCSHYTLCEIALRNSRNCLGGF